jgi:hypothetical protein
MSSNFPNFPLYKSLCNDDFKELNEVQKNNLLNRIKDMSDEKHSVVYALIYAYHISHDTHLQELPYGGKSLKNGLKFDIDHLPSQLQTMLFQFSTIDNSHASISTSPTSSKKRVFTLKNIDILTTLSKYGLVQSSSSSSLVSNISTIEKEDLTKTTRISDIITQESSDNMISFLDENKRKYSASVSMVDWMKNNKLPLSTHVKCFWCRHSFSTNPIGCPIKYINSIIEKSYMSYITKDRYYMKENVTHVKFDEVLKDDLSDMIHITPLPKNYYLTDGCFCSFNCMIAFIRDNNHDLFYKESYALAHGMYYDFYGKRAHLKSAPHWRLLSDFGGTKSITEFRDSFDNVSFEHMFTVRDVRTIGHVYKEKIDDKS